MSREREEWRDVQGLPGCRVSDHGNFAYPSGRINRGRPERRGCYRQIRAKGAAGQPVVTSVHREVLRAFDREPEPGELACHFPDKDPQNCALWNLQWGDHRVNGSHRTIHTDMEFEELLQRARAAASNSNAEPARRAS